MNINKKEIKFLKYFNLIWIRRLMDSLLNLIVMAIRLLRILSIELRLILKLCLIKRIIYNGSKK